MKADIHPKMNPTVFVDTSNGAEFVTVSTMSSKETRKIKGVDHFVVYVDISSASHPFYTGEKMLIDTAGRVDRFKARQQAADKLKVQHQASQQKKLVRESAEEKVTRKAKVNTQKKEAAKAEEEAPKKAAPKKAAAKAEKAPAKKEAAKKPASKKAE